MNARADLAHTTLVVWLGLWLSCLFWPFAHAGGFVAPLALSLAPLGLSVGDWLIPGAAKLFWYAAVFYGEVAINWRQWFLPTALLPVWARWWSALQQTSVYRWNTLNAHWATPLAVLGALGGWLIFRRVRTPQQVLVLWMVGGLVMPLDHFLWGLAALGPLVAYLSIGLGLMAWTHHKALRQSGRYVARRGGELWPLLGAIAVPVAAGALMPTHRAQIQGLKWLSAFSPTTPTTGYDPAQTNVTQSIRPNATPELLIRSPIPAYWQGAIYQTFNGRAWSNPAGAAPYHVSTDSFGLPLLTPFYSATLPVKTVTVRVTDLQARPLTSLVYTGMPIAFSHSVVIHPASDEITSTPLTRYQLTAEVPKYPPALLDFAPEGRVPPSLRPDLQIPSNLSPRVKALAERITRGIDTPWLKAVAIKSYLDHHERYSFHVTPTRHDAVNHFLFVDHEGYCDQFSSAFIMMMRELGVPARWVVGYDQGSYDPKLHGYLIKASDAHAWAQIWINRIGWVPFDPTPGWDVPIQLAAQSAPATPNAATNPIPPSVRIDIASLAPAQGRVAPRPVIPHPTHRLIQGPTGSSSTETVAAVIPRWAVFAASAAALASAVAAWVVKRRARRLPEQLWREMLRAVGAAERSLTPRQWKTLWLSRYQADAALVDQLVTFLEDQYYGNAEATPTQWQHARHWWQQLRKQRRPFRKRGGRRQIPMRSARG